LGQSLHQRGLTRTQVALQTDHVTKPKQIAQTHTNTSRLLRATTEKFQGVGI
jgi:hypothetical protein